MTGENLATQARIQRARLRAGSQGRRRRENPKTQLPDAINDR
jgi:hypothetical protein